MIDLLNSEFLAHALQRPLQTFSQCIGMRADFPGDLVPLPALGAKIRQPSLVVAEMVAHLGEQIARGNDASRGWLWIEQPFENGGDLHPASVPATGLLPARLIDDLVAGHRDKKTKQLLGFIQIKLPGCYTLKEIGEDGLANIHRIEDAAHTGIGDTHTDCATNLRLELLHEIGSGVLFTLSDALHKIAKTVIFGHGTPREEKVELFYERFRRRGWLPLIRVKG